MPDWKELIRRRLESVALDAARESQIVEELAQHLEDRYEALRSTGALEGEAVRQVIEELKDEHFAEELRKLPRPTPPEPPGLPARGSLFIGFWSDFKLALRNVRRKPAFSAMVIGMLALGVAGNSAIFSIFNGLFLRPLPFPDSERLVDLNETAPQWNLHYTGVSNPDFYEWRNSNSTFEGMAFFDSPSFNLSDQGKAQRVDAAGVTYNMLDVVGLKPVLGRNFLSEEDRPRGPHVVMLSYALWQRMFHADRNALGHVLKLDGEPYTIVGVLPPEPVFPAGADLWVPLQADPDPSLGGGWYLSGVGRLKPGVSIQQATADLLRVRRPNGLGGKALPSPIVTPLRERYLGDFRIVARLLLGGVVGVLLIVCVNVAALVLMRGAGRANEIAIRTALGASRGRVVRQLLTENFILAIAGGVLGVALGQWCLRAMLSLMPADNLPLWVDFLVDLRFLGFCVAVTGAATLLFGLMPAVQISRDARSMLAGSTIRSSPSRRQRRGLRILVISEIALALVLLVGAGSLMAALRKVLHADPGFRAGNVITFSISLPDSKYPEGRPRIAFFESLIERLQSVPGVKAVGATSSTPLGGHWGNLYQVEGKPPGANDVIPSTLQVVATSGYFDAMGMTFLAGRPLRDNDADSQHTRNAAGHDVNVRHFRSVVVNESFAKHYWPHENPIGKRTRTTNPFISNWAEVVGVICDEKHDGLDQETKPEVFLAYRGVPFDTMTVVLRSAIDPQLLILPAREIVHHMDPELPMYDIRTMTERVNQSLWMRRAYSWLFASFAIVALLLAAAGVYGVVSYAVSQRTQEIGIRIALGAQPVQVLREVLASGMALVALGVAIGLGVAFGIVRLLQSLLFGVSPRDPLIFVAVVATVATVGLLANFVPARRASSIDPMRALHFE